jgi:lysophospholipase L1-like esterase
LVPLLVGEAVCRFKGYGGYPPVLQVLAKIGERTYIGTNQAGLSTFFLQNRTVPGSMEEQVFTMPRGPNTVRIFALGESAMRGYPQPTTLAATSFLQAMLSDAWPGRQVEVLNLGTTALASFPLMYFADEVLQYQPDLVIVYAGNNEFYGAHGVASVHAFGQSTTAMRLLRMARRSALAQWLTDLATRPSAAPLRGSERLPTLMEQVIADNQIGPADARRGRAARNLENHLTYVVQQCRARGVPVLLCTLPANERDLAPIGDDVASSQGVWPRPHVGDRGCLLVGTQRHRALAASRGECQEEDGRRGEEGVH